MSAATFREKASAGWGKVPEWVAVLAQACDRTSQSAAARMLGVNDAYVSYAVRNKKPEYHGPVEDAVRDRLMGERVACPVLGEIGRAQCRLHRRPKVRALGPVEKRLRRVCPGCLHNPQTDGGDDAE